MSEREKKTSNDHVQDSRDSRSMNKYQRIKTDFSTKQTTSTKTYPRVITQSLFSAIQSTL